MHDTSPEAAAFQEAIYRKMSPERRVEIAWEMSLLAREFSLAGIRSEHPGFSENEVMHTYIREVLLSGYPASRK
jgi:hypothetical protein